MVVNMILAILIAAGSQTAQSDTAIELTSGVCNIPYKVYLPIRGGEGQQEWTLSGELPKGLTQSNGIIEGTPVTDGRWQFSVSVRDETGAVAQQRFVLEIMPPPPPPLTIATTAIAPLLRLHPSVFELRAEGGYPPYVWTLEHTAMPWVRHEKGRLEFNPQDIEHLGRHPLSISVLDSRGQSVGPVRLELNVEESPLIEPLTLEGDALPLGIQGHSYYGRVVANGGRAPYSFSMQPILPGLQMTTAGIVEGIPEQSGEMKITVEVIDADRIKTAAIYNLHILHFEPADLETRPLAPIIARINEELTLSLPVFGGVKPYRYSPSEGVPSWLSLENNLGKLVGTPQQAGTWTFDVSIRDAEQKEVTIPIMLHILPPPAPLTVLTKTLPDAFRGIPYTAALIAEGGMPPYVWTLHNTADIPWLSIDGYWLQSDAENIPGPGQIELHISVADAKDQRTPRHSLQLQTRDNPAITPDQVSDGSFAEKQDILLPDFKETAVPEQTESNGLETSINSPPRRVITYGNIVAYALGSLTAIGAVWGPARIRRTRTAGTEDISETSQNNRPSQTVEKNSVETDKK